MTGELQVDRIASYEVRIVGLVHQQDRGFAGRNVLQCGVEIGGSSEDVVDSAKPESTSIGFDRNGLIGQDLNSFRAKRAGHYARVGEYVMVPHDRPQTVAGVQFLQHLSARLGGRGSLGRVTEQRYRNEIPGQHDQFGMQFIHQVNCSAERVNREIGIVVEVAEKGDGKTIQAGGPTTKSNVLAHDSGTVGLDQDGVRGDRSYASGRCKPNKLSPIEGENSQSLSRSEAAGTIQHPRTQLQHTLSCEVRDINSEVRDSEAERSLQFNTTVG